MTEQQTPKRGVFRSIWRGTWTVIRVPFSTFPIGAIRDNARLIGALVERLRRPADPEPRLFKTEDGRIDLQATSFMLGLSAYAMHDRIAHRRRQTTRLAYLSFGLGWVFVALWIWRGLVSGLGGLHLLGAVQFIPFCAIFFLVAFKNAHANWQLRTGQLGSAGDYLRSPEPFWPS